MAPSVLLLGLNWESLPKDMQETIRVGLEQTEKIMLSAGYDYQGFFAHPDQHGRQPFTDAITSRKWDVVIIGFGVRGQQHLTEFFEWLVNQIRVHAPEAKLGFNSSPESTLDSAKRLAPL
ncbi:hypothetical protein BDW22DRAFT_1358940 [Trametopsis cervina]|nr:hypothetical protein BDW22DRAFT_1358940 [Trametopsis cervina]